MRALTDRVARLTMKSTTKDTGLQSKASDTQVRCSALLLTFGVRIQQSTITSCVAENDGLPAGGLDTPL